MRAYNSLRRVGIHTVDDLSARTEADLLAIENLGPQSVREIKERLAGLGRHLASSRAGSAAGRDRGRHRRGPPTAPRPMVRPRRGRDAGQPERQPGAGPGGAALAARPPDEDAIDLLSVAGFPVLKRALPVLGAVAVLLLVILGLRRARRGADRRPPRRRGPDAPPVRAGRCRFRAAVRRLQWAQSAPGERKFPSHEEPQMSKFLFLYRGPAMPMEDFTPSSPPSRCRRGAHGWATGSALADPGAPFGTRAAVSDNGSSPAPSDQNGYPSSRPTPWRRPCVHRRPPVPERGEGPLHRGDLRARADVTDRASRAFGRSEEEGGGSARAMAAAAAGPCAHDGPVPVRPAPEWHGPGRPHSARPHTTDLGWSGDQQLSADRSFALDCDAADPLAGFRERFLLEDPSLIYLDGNSLGMLPLTTADRIADVVRREWGTGLVRSWSHWIGLPGRAGDLLGSYLLGAAPGQVVVCDSTTVNLYKLARAALTARPGRTVIVTDDDNFPTDRYVLAGIAAERGAELRLIHTDLDSGVTADAVRAAVDSTTALVSLSHVAYRSGALADMAEITGIVHDVGALCSGTCATRRARCRSNSTPAAPTSRSAAPTST